MAGVDVEATLEVGRVGTVEAGTLAPEAAGGAAITGALVDPAFSCCSSNTCAFPALYP